MRGRLTRHYTFGVLRSEASVRNLTSPPCTGPQMMARHSPARDNLTSRYDWYNSRLHSSLPLDDEQTASAQNACVHAQRDPVDRPAPRRTPPRRRTPAPLPDVFGRPVSVTSPTGWPRCPICTQPTRGGRGTVSRSQQSSQVHQGRGASTPCVKGADNLGARH